MGYWNEVKDVVKKGVDLAGENIKEGAESVFAQAKDGVKTVQLRKDLFFKQREYQSAVSDVGDIVMDLYREQKDIINDAGFIEKVKAAESIEKECKKMEEELKSSEKEDDKRSN